MLRRILFLAMVVAIAPGCSTVKGWFGGKNKSKVDLPAELVAISSPIGVSKLWSVDLGDGEERQARAVGAGREEETPDADVVFCAVVGVRGDERHGANYPAHAAPET